MSLVLHGVIATRLNEKNSRETELGRRLLAF
jgi:hypothetical protein